jgi:hypothetical protein
LSLFENRPDPAGILYPYFEEELKSRGFEIGSRSKEYVRFTSKELAELLPKDGEGWPGKEIFVFEIDCYSPDRNAIARATISPGSNEKMRETIVTVAKALTSSSSFRNPAGIFLFQEAKVCAV